MSTQALRNNNNKTIAQNMSISEARKKFARNDVKKCQIMTLWRNSSMQIINPPPKKKKKKERKKINK